MSRTTHALLINTRAEQHCMVTNLCMNNAVYQMLNGFDPVIYFFQITF